MTFNDRGNPVLLLYVCMCTCVNMFTFMFTCVYIHMCVYVHMYVCSRVCIHADVCVCSHVCMFTSTHPGIISAMLCKGESPQVDYHRASDVPALTLGTVPRGIPCTCLPQWTELDELLGQFLALVLTNIFNHF